MAALSDPRAFLSAQEKRAQQMKAMGIEETDINTKDLAGGEGGGGGGAGKKGSKSEKSGAKPAEKKEGVCVNVDCATHVVVNCIKFSVKGL